MKINEMLRSLSISIELPALVFRVVTHSIYAKSFKPQLLLILETAELDDLALKRVMVLNSHPDVSHTHCKLSVNLGR